MGAFDKFIKRNDGVDEPVILSQDEANKVEPDLPPPGYKRDELMAERKDALDEQIDKTLEDREVHAFDPSKLEKDREILSQLQDNQLAISNRQPGFEYKWVYFGQSGQMVWQAKADGWEVVSGQMTEAIEHRAADNTRRIGDTLLMRTPEEHYKEIRAREEKKAADREKAITSNIKQLGDKYRNRGIIVHTGDEGEAIASSRRSGARAVAQKQVDQMIREGTVPGMPIPGKEGK